MRLAEVERGDTLGHRILIRMISRFAGYRLPDAARVAFYDRRFVGPVLGEWTQKTMRGPGSWSVSERELMAAMVASWNTCPFCIGAHRAIAVRGIEPAVADAVLADYRTAPISDRLRAALVFLERMTREPDQLSADDARAALDAGLTTEELEDAAAVAALFNIIARNANALDFEIPSASDFESAAGMLLRRGYA
ncbi:hypothetical protein GCM10022239_20130 [Leifsonia bigeumensis]|uniref:Carboxymuconolactone decarboxylase-like domain-containing protein n=1 Tax=Leifsonella bigeumensis TaxID=433643 RepID=A0ABP7FNY6_9MICO